MMKRLFLTLTLTLALAACAQTPVLPIARDIANIQLMRTMALDEGTGGKLKTTVSGGIRPSEGGSPQPPVILTDESDTVFGSILHIQTYGDGYVSFGHISQCILSEAAADSAGVFRLLDFVERDFETRITTDLYLSGEDSAAELLTETAGETHSAAERLDSLRRDFGLESHGWRVTVRDFLQDMEDNGCSLLPVLRLEKTEDGATLVSSEMGWFRDGIFQGTLTPEQSRAAAILSKHLESSAVELTLRDGTEVGLRLTRGKVKLRPVWEGERLTGLNLSVHLSADIAEEHGTADFHAKDILKEAEQRLCGVISGELRELLNIMQEEKADFLHFGQKTAVLSPSKHRILEQNWSEWFPNLDFTLGVTADIQRSYDVGKNSEFGIRNSEFSPHKTRLIP